MKRNDEHVGAVGDGRRLGGHGRGRAGLALVLLTATLALPSSAVSYPAPIEPFVLDDGGAGSTACVNVELLRYYLCVRADGSSYRIYY